MTERELMQEAVSAMNRAYAPYSGTCYNLLTEQFELITHGIPAQPGNMTLVAYLGDVPILGVPGAAIKLPTTIFDVLLPSIFAEEKITKEDLIHLADGGLCQMCTTCHWPNCTFGRY